MDNSFAATLSTAEDKQNAQPPVSISVPEVSLLVFSRLLQGDQALLSALGLSEADVYPLRALPSEALTRLFSRAASDVIEIRLRRDALQHFLHYLQTDSRSEREIRIMIEAEASHAFMQHFYRLSYSAYHQYRQQAGLLRTAGRPSMPDAKVIAEIERLLRKLDLLANPKTVGPFDLLAIHQLTGYSLREVWWVFGRAICS